MPFHQKKSKIINKIRLNEFKRKIIIDKENDNMRKTQTLEKKLDTFFDNKEGSLAMPKLNSTQNSFERSTFQNSKYTTFKDFDPQREVKTSNGSYAPKYNFINLDLQKKWNDDKHKELTEKRNAVEMKKFMNDWGFQRGKFKEEVERKQDILILLKNYEVINEVKEHYSDSSDNEVENNLLTKEYLNNKNTNIEKIKNVKKDVIINNFIGNDQNTILKTKIFEVKTMIESKEFIINNIINSIKEKDSTLSEVNHLIQANDKVTKMRKHLITITNDTSSIKVDHSNHLKPLSLYDSNSILNTLNYPSPNKKSNEKSLNNELLNLFRPSTSLDFKLFNPEVNNMLKQRRTLSNFNFSEIIRLKDDLAKSAVDISLKILKGGLLPPRDTQQYEKLYLPSSGFGLLQNPFPEGKKTTKK